MSLKLKIKTKKHSITWDLKKFMQNIICSAGVMSFFIMLAVETIIKANIFQIY